MKHRAATRGASARTLELLGCMAGGEREFELKDLAARARLAPSTVHRLLDFWVQRDLLERAGSTAYRLGPELFRLASLLVQKYEPSRLAQPLLQQLWQSSQETALFCALNRNAGTASAAAAVTTTHPLKYEIALHSTLPLIWGSLGRAILSQLPSAEVSAILRNSAPGPVSRKPPPSRRVLEKALDAIRSQGYAVYEDAELNMAGVSAPVMQAGLGVVGSIGVIMPATRFTPLARRQLPGRVAAAARSLSSALGYRR